MKTLLWQQGGDGRYLIYYGTDPQRVVAEVYDEGLCVRLVRRYNALVGYVHTECLHELLDRLGRVELPPYERDLVRRCLHLQEPTDAVQN